MNIAFPFRFDGGGGTARVDDPRHILDMLHQLIFTSPGERVNRPDFGSGLLQLIFAANSPEFAATVQFTVRAAIQRWLGDLIEIEDLTVEAVDATLSVDLKYVIRRTNQRQTALLTRRV